MRWQMRWQMRLQLRWHAIAGGLVIRRIREHQATFQKPPDSRPIILCLSPLLRAFDISFAPSFPASLPAPRSVASYCSISSVSSHILLLPARLRRAPRPVHERLHDTGSLLKSGKFAGGYSCLGLFLSAGPHVVHGARHGPTSSHGRFTLTNN